MTKRNVNRELQKSLRGVCRSDSFEAISTAIRIKIASLDAGKRKLVKTEEVLKKKIEYLPKADYQRLIAKTGGKE